MFDLIFISVGLLLHPSIFLMCHIFDIDDDSRDFMCFLGMPFACIALVLGFLGVFVS